MYRNLKREPIFEIPYFFTGSELTQEFMPSTVANEDELFNLALVGNKGNF